MFLALRYHAKKPMQSCISAVENASFGLQGLNFLRIRIFVTCMYTWLFMVLSFISDWSSWNQSTPITIWRLCEYFWLCVSVYYFVQDNFWYIVSYVERICKYTPYMHIKYLAYTPALVSIFVSGAYLTRVQMCNHVCSVVYVKYVYNTPCCVIDASDFKCCIFMRVHPLYIPVKYLAYMPIWWAYLFLAHIWQ